MLGIMGLSALFANAARAKKQVNELRFVGSTADPIIQELSCTGEITIISTKGGNPQTATYSDLVNTYTAIEADANTEVVITGDVTTFVMTDEEWADLTSLHTEKCKTLRSLFLGGCAGITSLNLSSNNKLGGLTLDGCSNITSLDLSSNNDITDINLMGCSSLVSLDLSSNTKLTTLDCSNCNSLSSLILPNNSTFVDLQCSGLGAISEIKYPATNGDVSTAVAGAITNADDDDGTVYTDSAAAYYSTIADAATAKGWTIEQLA